MKVMINIIDNNNVFDYSKIDSIKFVHFLMMRRRHDSKKHLIVTKIFKRIIEHH